MTPSPSTPVLSRPAVPLLLAGAIAAVLLTLGVYGTLAAWTTAEITNSTNTAAAVGAVSLAEASGGSTCIDTANQPNNTATCTTINKYGGTATPLAPGQSATVVVTMTNTGTSTGALTIKAGACSRTDTAPTTGNICDHLSVALTCDTDSNAGTPEVAIRTGTLTNWATTEAAPAAISNMTAGQAIGCTFTTTLSPTAPSSVAGQTGSQPLTWTLAGV